MAKIKPIYDVFLYQWETECGPPIYKRITCVRCHKSKGVLKTHGPKRYCNECKPLVPKAAGAAIGRVTAAIRRGELPPPSSCICVDCGRQAQVYDHRHYGSPLDVKPVCKSCNRKRGPANWGAAHINAFFLEPAPL